MKRYLPALALVLLIVASAPFMGVIRDLLFDRFEAATVRYLALALITLAAAAFLYAVARIRHHRLPRYAALALAATLLWLQETVLGHGISDAGLAARVSVAEKIHLVEYGLLAYLLYRALLFPVGAPSGRRFGDLATLLLPLFWVTVAGVLDEGMQWLVETRLGEIRDVFLNVYAGVCGLVFSLALDPPESFRWRLSAGGRRRLADAAAFATLALGLFFYVAHLGYEHFHPEIGRFRSWHSLEQLRAAAADRSSRWQRDPPSELSPWKREDFYLTEAGWHATHRNERYRAGDAYLAAQANRILEEYYAPFLDLESFRGSGKHRYPPEVRRELEERAPRHDPERYLSPVLTGRVYPWPPKGPFLAVLIMVVVAIWSLPRISRRRP